MTERRKATIAKFRSLSPLILPSMLQCNFGNLAAEIESLEAASTKAIHLDVMDGNFVPNLTYGMPIAEAFRKLTRMPIDAHLMIADPAKYADQFVRSGVDAITFHIEACPQPTELLKHIQLQGVAAGLVINPSTDIESLLPFVDLCDLVLVMSVEAGFGGQAFNASMLDRTRKLRAEFGPDLLIEMDGGIGEKTIRDCREAGADMFVVGSAIFGKSHYGDAIARLNEILSVAS
jgi:ribulose-phosphate 3-epimerase